MSRRVPSRLQMSDEATAKDRWNDRYDSGAFGPLPDAPARWLVDHEDLLRDVARRAAQPRAIDVACGDGRNAVRLAELGFAVDAVDISDVAIAALRDAASRRGLRLDARVLDLERETPAADAYDVVVCMRYLQRDLFPALRRALRRGGVLLYETFSRAHVEELGKPFNPAYVLDRGELREAFADLEVLDYREGVAELGHGPSGVASIVARRLV